MPRPRVEPADLFRLLPTARSPRRASRPLRVVHLLPTLGWGGAERIGCTLHRLGVQHGFDSRIDAPARADVAEAIARETGEPAPAHRDGEESLRGWALGARARLAANPPDVVHAQLPFPDRLSAALIACRGLPAVITFQLLPETDRPWPPDAILHQRCDRIDAVLGRLWWRARFVAVSAADRSTLARWLPAQRVDHVANAPPLPRARPPALPPLAWPDGTVRLLSVGRLHRQKGFDRILAALATPRVRSLPWHWCVVGEGPERENLERGIREAGLMDRVTLAGDRPADDAFSAAELVLVGSRWEGMPMVPMEAASAGTAALVSPIAPHRELLSTVADALLPDDDARWAEPMAELIADPARRRALAEAERAAQPADPRGTMWAGYRRLYEAAAGL